MFRFTWTCRAQGECLDVYAPGVTKIEYDIEDVIKGEVNGATLLLRDPGKPIWIKLSKDNESTKWIQLKPGFGDSFVLGKNAPRFDLGV